MNTVKKKSRRPSLFNFLAILLVTAVVWDIRSAGSFKGELLSGIFLLFLFIYFLSGLKLKNFKDVRSFNLLSLSMNFSLTFKLS